MKLDQLEQKLKEIKEFKNLNLSHGRISDPQKFIDLSISYLKSQSGNRRYLAYYDRLLEFYLLNK
jgi:hypothetical protein